MTTGRLWLSWLAVMVLASPRGGFVSGQGSGDPADRLQGIEVERDTRDKITTYTPRIDEWPRPVRLIYPIVTARDSGTRTIGLWMGIKDARIRRKDSLRVVIDGTPLTFPLDQKGRLVADNTGCRRLNKITLEEQESLIRDIVVAKEVEISVGSDERARFSLEEGDFERARRMLALFDAKAALPATKGVEDPGVRLPELIPASKVWPRVPPEALRRMREFRVRVTLEAWIRLDGTVGDLRVSEPAGGDCGFEEAALAAVKQWRYKPGTKNGQPAETNMTIVIEFMAGSSAPAR